VLATEFALFEHVYDLVRAHGEVGWTARLVPLTVDGLVYASSMVMLDPARRNAPVPGLARWLLGLGIAATLATNVAHGLGHGLIGAAVAAWPAVALVGSYELLMLIIRGTQARPETTVMPPVPDADPLQGQAAQCARNDDSTHVSVWRPGARRRAWPASLCIQEIVPAGTGSVVGTMLSATMRSMGLNAMPCPTSLTVSPTVSISIELPLTSHRRATPGP
jgi:hypothetical protein